MGYHVWGPNEHFRDYGIKLSPVHASSTIHAIDGETRFELRWPSGKDLFLSCCLQDIENESRLQAGRVMISSMPTVGESTITTAFHIRMQETGYFVLQVFARPKDVTSNKRIGGWLLVVDKKSNKPRFPEECMMSGPNEVFYKLGMKTNLTKLETSSGKGCIEVQYDADVEKSFRYSVTSYSYDKFDDVVAMTTTAIRPHAVYVTSFRFTLPCENVYSFRLMTVGEGNEWLTIGNWGIIYDRSGSPNKESPAKV
ncbi:uncharacterized protein [Diadema setosum]|uniref:uncharacterized protein n=1 Tax=Diadema setosum TaxID=31175 RepID=UPI003B3B0EF3